MDEVTRAVIVPASPRGNTGGVKDLRRADEVYNKEPSR